MPHVEQAIKERFISEQQNLWSKVLLNQAQFYLIKSSGAIGRGSWLKITDDSGISLSSSGL
jgi:hypothetical protein